MKKKLLLSATIYIASLTFILANNFMFNDDLSVMANSVSTQLTGCNSTSEGSFCYDYGNGTGACFFNGHLNEYCKQPVLTKPTM